MCGLCGVFNKSRLRAVPEDQLGDMSRVLERRGPDDSGIWLGNGVGLGHRRLSIIDIAGGKQPMHGVSGCVIVYNGEVYNSSDLRAQLSGKHDFLTTSDTEVVLAAYENWGVDGLEKLRGMYAIAIYDPVADQLVLARDGGGIKPLYYCVSEQGVVFASNTRSILASGIVANDLSATSFSDFISYRYPLDNKTFYHSVSALRPGETLVFSRSRIVNRTLRPWAGRASEATGASLRDEIVSSVQCHEVADVPVGAFLSGGLDSTIVATIMAERRSNLHTYSVGIAGDAANENALAEETAREIGSLHTSIDLQLKDYWSKLEEYTRWKGAPVSVPNEVLISALSTEAAKSVKVILAGEGADEAFGGYGRIFRSPLDYYKAQFLAAEKTLLSLPEARAFSNRYRSEYGVEISDPPLRHFINQYSRVGEQDKAALFLPIGDHLSQNGGLMNELFLGNALQNHLGTTNSLYCAYMNLFQQIHLPGLLDRLDSATMSASLEGRVPFTDRVVLGMANSLPVSERMSWKQGVTTDDILGLEASRVSERFDVPKQALRAAFEGYVPNRITTRTKLGFPLPIKDLLHAGGFDFLADMRLCQMGLVDAKTVERLKAVPEASYLMFLLASAEVWLRNRA